MHVADVLILMSGVLFAGFAGMIFFQRTGIPDVLALIGLGVVLGPILHIVEPENLREAAPYLGAFALMMILFEGGLDLNVKKVVSQSGRALVLLFFSFVLSLVSITYLASVVIGLDFVPSLMLGGILACTSGPIIIPIVHKLSINQDVKTVVSLESAMSDALSVVVVVTLLNLGESGTIEAASVGGDLLKSFLIAFVVAFVLGMVWLGLLSALKDHPFAYIITLAMLLLIQGGIEHIGGSGAMAILLFGMVLGNGSSISTLLGSRIKTRLERLFESGWLELDEGIKHLHAELTFFVRTFFFVYLGVLFDVGEADGIFWMLSAALIVAMVMTRFISVSILRTLFTLEPEDSRILWTMLPRGLASAVLASMPVAAGIAGTEGFPSYAFVAIIVTNLIMTVSLFIWQRKQGSSMRGKSDTVSTRYLSDYY